MKAKRPKIKTHECDGIKIRELSGEYFQTDFMRDGKRERQGFKTLAEAEEHCRLAAAKLRTDGTSILDLTGAQRDDAGKALKATRGKVSLVEAVRFWMRHNANEDGVTVAELGRRWLANLKTQGCRATTLVERGHKVDRMAADMGAKPIANVTRDDIEAWLSSKGLTGATWDGYRRAYRAMFGYAVKTRLLDSNPAAAIDPMRTDEKLPTPFTVEAATAIMRTAEKYAPITVPTLAVQFFAGLRPGEALGLDWAAVDFKQKIIRVLPETSKVRRSRIIEMNATLIDWLTPYRKLAGPIGIQTPSQQNFYLFRKPIGPAYEQEGIPKAERPEDKRPKGIAKAAGVEWIQDGPRKTYATMHFAQHGDADKLAGVLGHTSGSGILYKHYRGLATKADARRYWKIRPATKGAAVVVANFKKATA